MDAKVIYWTAAWLNMAGVLALALLGIRQVRARHVAQHRRRMLGAAFLVVAFLLSYLAKLATLGREALDTWAPFYVHTLRFHETCVAFMVIGGSLALFLATRLRLARAADGSAGRYPPEQVAARLRLHRRAGKTAVWASALGLASAGVVLFGMYQRL